MRPTPWGDVVSARIAPGGRMENGPGFGRRRINILYKVPCGDSEINKIKTGGARRHLSASCLVLNRSA